MKQTIPQYILTLIIGSILMLICSFPAYCADKSIDVNSLARGAKLWGDNCARCHNMRAPKEFDDAQWKVIVTHMRLRAGLTGQDARDIIQFLQTSN